MPSREIDIEAQLLTGEHIGCDVALDVKLGQNGPTDGTYGIDARVTAQLRQVYHTSSETVIHVCAQSGHDEAELIELLIVPPTKTVTITVTTK